MIINDVTKSFFTDCVKLTKVYVDFRVAFHDFMVHDDIRIETKQRSNVLAILTWVRIENIHV